MPLALIEKKTTMSRPNDAVGEEEDDECFYESLDRVLSSCSCSTSNSDYDSDPSITDPTHDSKPNPFPVPRFPMGASEFDLWTSEPESVSERRTRLLREMGLSRDPDLSPAGQPGSGSCTMEMGASHFARSVSSDGLTRKDHRNRLASGNGRASFGIFSATRSKSGGQAGRTISSGYNGDFDQHRLCNLSSCSCSALPVCSSSVCSHVETDETCPSVNIPHDNSSDHNVDNDDHNGDVIIVGKCYLNHNSKPCTHSNCIGGSVSGVVLPNNPPMGKIFQQMDENPSLNCNLGCNSSSVSGRNVGKNLDCSRSERAELNEQVCTIKNLNTGKEFVVNEVREDGTWKKLKEVGTGRQLTMEEFDMCVGTSPIVLELMRRQNVEDSGRKDDTDLNAHSSGSGGSKHKRKGSWLKSIRSVASSVTGHKERRSNDERDTSSEKGGQRCSSATDDSQDVSFHGPERVRVRQYGKSCKELTALFKSQEIQAHNGSIWCIKFSLDGRYLASAGEDRAIHVWQVVVSERNRELLLMDKSEEVNVNLLFLANGLTEPTSLSPKRRGRTSISRKSLSLDNIVVPETVFGFSEKPVCSFLGHQDDVLDLSWSKSQHLLSSSMDKTVRLWHLSSKTCLKVFSHSDYVTCIQFNPVDDSYFISGSLDAKVRIWSIPDRQVVDWSDLHEMVTAACYTPDGQGALVGSYKGSCDLYNTSDNKLQQKSQINLQNRKKKSNHKKITGFQFGPGSSSEVLITSADSRTRVVDGVDLVHKFKGFRNTNSQISASLTANGKYLVSASEDSHVYIWKYESSSRPNKSKSVTVTNSYEHFHCQDVSVAIPWPGSDDSTNPDETVTANHPPTPVNEPCFNHNNSKVANGIMSSVTNGYFFDRISATWPEEKLVVAAKKRSPRVSVDMSNVAINPIASAWGMVIVTAGLKGEIRTFQNFGLPVRI